MNDFRQQFRTAVRAPGGDALESFMLLDGRYSNFTKETFFLRYAGGQGCAGPEAADEQGVPGGGGAGSQQQGCRQQDRRRLFPEAPGLEGPGPPWQGGEYVLCQTLPHSLRGGAAVHRVIIRVHVSTHSFRRASRPRFSLIFTVGTVTPSSRAIS